MKIVLASNNQGKLAELQALFGPLGCSLIAQSELGVPEAPEPFKTFVENALAKARNAAEYTGLPALADDAGLCVDALGGEPGVDTAYYATRFGYAKGDDNKRCWSRCAASRTAVPLWSAPWWRCVFRKTLSH